MQKLGIAAELVSREQGNAEKELSTPWLRLGSTPNELAGKTGPEGRALSRDRNLLLLSKNNSAMRLASDLGTLTV